MIPHRTHVTAKLWRALRSFPLPGITQDAYDGDSKHLHGLAQLNSDDRARVSDLWEYTQDLLYTEIQTSLLAHLLPFCLEAWRDDLLGTSTEYGGFVEQFYPAVANRHIFDRHLKPDQTAAVSEFMRASILEEIDGQRGLAHRGTAARPYRWITAMTTHGVLLPDVEKLWIEWWAVGTIGRAVAAVQYISCLMYSENENPVFAPWTPEGGGGPPCLWEFGGHLYTQRWLEANVDFLKSTLNTQAASDVLNRSVEQLIGQPEHARAAQVRDDLPLCAEVLTARCADLPRLLATTQEPGKLLAWSE